MNVHDVDHSLKNFEDDADAIKQWLDGTDTKRRDHEIFIKKKLAEILPPELGFSGARLSWTMLARLARWLETKDKSVKLRIFLGMFPHDFKSETFIEENGLRKKLDLPEKVEIIFSISNMFTKKGNLVN